MTALYRSGRQADALDTDAVVSALRTSPVVTLAVGDRDARRTLKYMREVLAELSGRPEANVGSATETPISVREIWDAST